MQHYPFRQLGNTKPVIILNTDEVTTDCDAKFRDVRLDRRTRKFGLALS